MGTLMTLCNPPAHPSTFTLEHKASTEEWGKGINTQLINSTDQIQLPRVGNYLPSIKLIFDKGRGSICMVTVVCKDEQHSMFCILDSHSVTL